MTDLRLRCSENQYRKFLKDCKLLEGSSQARTPSAFLVAPHTLGQSEKDVLWGKLPNLPAT